MVCFSDQVQKPYRMVIQYHDVFGQWYVPNISVYVPHERGVFFVKTNRDGMRSSRNYEKERSATRRRFLVFGDSFTAGEGVSNSERFTDLLEQNRTDVEVLNFGLNGSGLDQQLLIFEYFQHLFESDVILLCPMVENIRRAELHYWPVMDGSSGEMVFVPKPYFTLEEGNLDLHNVPVPRDRPRFSDAPSKYQKMFDPQKEFGRVRRFGKRYCLPFLAPLLNAWGYQRYPQYDSADNPLWVLCNALLERMMKEVGKKQVVLAPLPPYPYIEKFCPPTYLDRYREFASAYPRLIFVDLLPYFHRLSLFQRRRCRYAHDTHYTPLGHRVVADALEKELTRYGLITRGE